MHARWYNTDTGQFDTRDPADVSPVPDSGSANRYAYAGGNPLTRVDPSGNAFMEGCKSVGGCLVQGFVNAFDFLGMVKDLWNALSDIKATINSFANSMKEEAARWRGTIRGMMPCPWWVPNKVCDTAAEIGGWACALSGVCEIIQDCMNAISDHGSRMQCAEHVGGALADGVQGLVSGGAAAVGKFLAKRLLDKLRLPKKGHDNSNDNDDSANKSSFGDSDIYDEMRYLRKHRQKQNQGNKHTPTKWKPPGKPKKNNGPKPPPGAKNGAGSKNNAPPPPPKPRTPDPRPQHSAPPPAPAMPGLIDLPRNPGGRSDGDNSDRSDGGISDRSDRENSGSSCEHSFDPSTQVLMADGSAKAIKDVRLGEKVAATDPATGATTAQPVTALHVNLDRELTDVSVRSVNEGEGDRSTRGPTVTLETTQNHPFWDVTAGAWVEAKDLEPGKSTLTGPDGLLQEVVAVRNFTGAETMRDLTVANIHTYYVVAADEPVLVHNCGWGGGMRNKPHKLGMASGWLTSKIKATFHLLTNTQPKPNATVRDLIDLKPGNRQFDDKAASASERDSDELLNSVFRPQSLMYMTVNPHNRSVIFEGNHRRVSLLSRANDPDDHSITMDTQIYIHRFARDG